MTVELEKAVELSLNKETSSDTRDYLIAILPDPDSEKQYQLISVSPNDKIGGFIQTSIKRLEGYIANPETIPVPKENARGRRISKRVQRDVQKNRVKDYKFEIAVLRGNIMAPITLIEKNPGFDYRISKEKLSE